MCRRCGEPDRRGPARARRIRKSKLLAGAGVESPGGNGVITVCTWCFCLLGLEAGTLAVADHTGAELVLEVRKLEEDRLAGNGSPYRMDNLVASCHPCNIGRVYDTLEIPEGCAFGPESIELVRAARAARLVSYGYPAEVSA